MGWEAELRGFLRRKSAVKETIGLGVGKANPLGRHLRRGGGRKTGGSSEEALS